MKSVIIGSIVAIAIAIGSWAVLDGRLQQTAEQRFSTTGVRL